MSDWEVGMILQAGGRRLECYRVSLVLLAQDPSKIKLDTRYSHRYHIDRSGTASSSGLEHRWLAW